MPSAAEDPLIRTGLVADEAEIKSLGVEYQDLFAVLRDAGFDLVIEDFTPQSFGSFIVTCHRNDAMLRVINDRSEIYYRCENELGRMAGQKECPRRGNSAKSL